MPRGLSSPLPVPLPLTAGELPRTLEPRRLPQTLPYSESGPLHSPREGVGERPRTCKEPEERASSDAAAFDDEPFSFATAMGSGGVAVAGEGGARDWASVMGSLMCEDSGALEKRTERGRKREKERRRGAKAFLFFEGETDCVGRRRSEGAREREKNSASTSTYKKKIMQFFVRAAKEGRGSTCYKSFCCLFFFVQSVLCSWCA